LTRLNRPLTTGEEKVLFFLADKFILGEKEFLSATEIYKGINREVSPIYLRLVLSILAEHEYLESMRFGKFSSYYLGFRINNLVGSVGAEIVATRRT